MNPCRKGNSPVLENVLELMVRQDLDLDEMAAKTGLDENYLGRLLADKERMSPDDIVRLAVALSCSIDDLFKDRQEQRS